MLGSTSIVILVACLTLFGEAFEHCRSPKKRDLWPNSILSSFLVSSTQKELLRKGLLQKLSENLPLKKTFVQQSGTFIPSLLLLWKIASKAFYSLSNEVCDTLQSKGYGHVLLCDI